MSQIHCLSNTDKAKMISLKILTFILIAVILISNGITAFAEVWQDGEPSALWFIGTINAVDAPGSNKIVGTMTRKATFTFTDSGVSGWVKVRVSADKVDNFKPFEGFVAKTDVRVKKSTTQDQSSGSTWQGIADGISSGRPFVTPTVPSSDGGELSSSAPSSGRERTVDTTTLGVQMITQDNYGQSSSSKTAQQEKQTNDGLSPFENEGKDLVRVSSEWNSMIASIGNIFVSLAAMGGAIGLAWCGVEFAYGSEEVASKAKSKAFIIVVSIVGLAILASMIRLGISIGQEHAWSPSRLN